MNIARADRFHVRTQTYDGDVPLNRILGAALDELDGLALSGAVAARAGACRVDFPEVAAARPTAETFDRLRLGRTTVRYQGALGLARMLLEHSAPQLRTGRTHVFALLFDMNVLWERYIAALFRRAAGNALEVSTQERHAFWRGGIHRRGVRPDIVVRSRASGEALLIADTKWKVIGDGPPSDGDLQQMFVYNELLRARRAVLVYPGVRGSTAVGGPYERRAHGCETVHLALLEGTRWSSGGLRQQVATVLANIGGAAGGADELVPLAG